eukprot:scaffold53311_cov47-Phaeocystis_antarctica.AAC.1
MPAQPVSSHPTPSQVMSILPHPSHPQSHLISGDDHLRHHGGRLRRHRQVGHPGIVFTLSSLCLHSLYKLAGTDNSSHWGRLKAVLEVSSHADNMADGASGGHTCAARHEAANKLVTNYAAVIRDVTRPDGSPVSQPNLKRMPGCAAR